MLTFDVPIWFQFHEGPIKTVFPGKWALGVCRFNSMKVRLKLPFHNPIEQYIRFQFHEGPIKTKDNFGKEIRQSVSIP